MTQKNIINEETNGIPEPGDSIRTPKLEGKVTKVEEGYVYFTTPDGRSMRNKVQNCTVIEKLEDQDEEIFEDEELNEISTEMLAKYKTAAGADARAADKQGDTQRGNKRFSGIVKATKKQFDNDKKKSNEGYRVVPGIDKERYQERDGLEGPFHAKNGKVVYYDPREGKYYDPDSDFYISQEDWDAMNEGSMGGINRSAPAVDVSYEKVLDEVKQRWMAEQASDSNDIVKTFDADAAAKETARQLRDLLNRPSEKLTPGMIRLMREFETRVYVDYSGKSCKVIDMLEGCKNLNELSVGKLKAYKDAATSPSNVRTMPLRDLEKHRRGAVRANDKIKTKTGVANRQGPDRGAYDEAFNPDDFKDILGRQHKEVQAAAPKGKVSKIPHHGWEIRYREAITPGEKINWKIFDKKGEEKHSGTSLNSRDAVADAQDWINAGGGTSQVATSKVTIDFNVDFAKEFAPGGEKFYALFMQNKGTPGVYISTEPQKDFKASGIRTQKDKATGTTTLLPSISMGAKEANEVGLKPNGRYILGDKQNEDANTDFFPLIYQSTTQSRTDTVRLGKPGLTVAAKREVDEEYRGPWQGDPTKLAKAPKSSMQGKDEIRLSELVRDTIDEHGVKWAFEYYVKKHGMPPRQFQIFAGLNANPLTKPKVKPDWTDPSKATKPKKKSFWASLRDKMPFEE